MYDDVDSFEDHVMEIIHVCVWVSIFCLQLKSDQEPQKAVIKQGWSLALRPEAGSTLQGSLALGPALNTDGGGLSTDHASKNHQRNTYTSSGANETQRNAASHDLKAPQRCLECVWKWGQ